MRRYADLAVFAIAAAAIAAAQDKPAPTRVPAGGVEVPLKTVSEQPACEVHVNGEGPFLMLFDTGAAGGGRIHAELAERLKLPVVDEVQAGDPSGRNTRVAKRLRADEVQIGSATFQNVLLVRREHSEPGGGDPREGVVGIIGIGLFADCLVTLDYPGGKLRIERGELPPADGREIFDFVNDRGIPNMMIRVDGVDVRADVDSGSMGGLTVPTSLVSKLQLARPPAVVGRGRTSFNEFEIKESRLKDDFRLGRHRFEKPTIAFNDILPHGNLGSALLCNFAITIDQKNKRIRFARAGDEPIRTAPRYRVGVAFVPGPEGFEVREVAPNAAGAAAGLKPGDRIVRVNGRSASEINDTELRKLCGRPETIRLTVERNGQTLEIELKPKLAE